MYINYYKKWSEPSVLKTIPITEWLDNIKQSEFSDQILNGRHNEELYDSIKANLPCVTYNFLFDSYKLNNNIKGATGCLYIDIDSPEFDPQLLDLNQIYSYYHSYGGVGYSLLVLVEGLTLSNFSSTYLDICLKLGILDYIDKDAVKASQYNVLSYDPNIYINTSPVIFQSVTNSTLTYELASSYVSKSTSYNNVINFTPTPYVKNKKITYTYDLGELFSSLGHIRFSNIHQSEVEGDYVYDWENGFEEVRCIIPFKKLTDKRKRTLLAYTANFVYLNPFLSFERTFMLVLKVSKKMSEDPLDYHIVEGIVTSIYKQKDAGTLVPKTNTRKIIFSSTANLTGQEKRNLCIKLYNEYRVNNSKIKIENSISNWNYSANGKITASKVSLSTCLNIKTVEKYWKHFKSKVSLANERFKIESNLENLRTNPNNVLMLPSRNGIKYPHAI